MNKFECALKAVEALKVDYPEAKCSLVYKDPVQLLVATRLSAQCTDERVNKVTPDLFGAFPDVYSLASAKIEDVEKYIHSCGLYKTKAKDIVYMCKALVANYNGKVPDNIDELIKLPGVGRKTANLIIGDVYNKPAVVVDTHCIRITKRLGLHDSSDARKIENILRELIPADESNDFCHRLVLHGRAVCKARGPKCEVCSMNSFCQCYKKM